MNASDARLHQRQSDHHHHELVRLPPSGTFSTLPVDSTDRVGSIYPGVKLVYGQLVDMPTHRRANLPVRELAHSDDRCKLLWVSTSYASICAADVVGKESQALSADLTTSQLVSKMT